MIYVITSLILCSLFLAVIVLVVLNLFKMMKQLSQSQLDLEKQRTATTKHLANLLASKDPLAFQQVQTVSVMPDTGYTGPYLSGDELELMEQELKNMDAAWNRAEDTE